MPKILTIPENGMHMLLMFTDKQKGMKPLMSYAQKQVGFRFAATEIFVDFAVLICKGLILMRFLKIN